MLTRVSLFLAVTSLTCGLASPPVLAAPDQVGLAVIVRNNVSEVEPTPAKITTGDDVVRDEIIQTMADSQAKVVLKDSTNLVLGPNSTLKLDRTVFTDATSIGEIAVKLTTGSFRFITGHSAKEAYVITTPIATLGIRGTVLDFQIAPLVNRIVLQNGQSHVCANNRNNTGNPNNPPNNPANTNNTGTNCVDLTQPGDTAVVTPGGITKVHSDDSFDCQGLCDPITFAEAETLTTGSIPGGGGGGGGPTGPNPTPSNTNTGTLGTSPGPTPTVTTTTTGLLGNSGGGNSFKQVTPQ